MLTILSHGARRVGLQRLAAAAMLLLCGLATLYAAESPVEIVRVEEDWKLVLLEPDSDNNAPQITCVTSPGGDVSGVYAAFEVNHRTQPDYSAGGMQLQLWNGESLTVAKNGAKEGSLRHIGETICWTQQMQLDGGSLHFEVLNGTSESWDTFGGQGYLKTSVTTNLSNLNSYSPTVSVNHSGVGFASNRVAKLALVQVRYYTADGLVATDSTQRVVHEQD